MAGHDPNMQCTPGRQALVAPVPASDPLATHSSASKRTCRR
jgi:hypothetical protein